MSIVFNLLQYKNLTNWSVAHLLANQFNYNEEFKLERIGNFLSRNKTQIIIDDNAIYKRVTIRLYNKGVKLRDAEVGRKIGTKKQFLIHEGQFLMSKIDARNGAFGIATEEVDNAIITADFFAYDIDESKILPQFLVLLTTTKQFQKFAQSASSGTTGRQRMDERKFLDVKIPLPSLSRQKFITEKYSSRNNEARLLEKEIECILTESENSILQKLGIEINSISKVNSILQLVKYSELVSWGVNKLLLNRDGFRSKYYELKSLGNYCTLVRGVTYKKTSEVTTDGYRVLRANNINLDNTLNFDDVKCVSFKEQFPSEKLLRKNDVFICLASGSKKHIGKVVFIEQDLNYYFGGFMGVIRITNSELSPEFLNIILNTSLFNNYLSSKIFGSNINNLNAALLYSFKMPIPPHNIQAEIVKIFNNQKEEIKNLKENAKTSRSLSISEFEKEIFN